jgi:hypothetical protein
MRLRRGRERAQPEIKLRTLRVRCSFHDHFAVCERDNRAAWASALWRCTTPCTNIKITDEYFAGGERGHG